MKKTLLLIVLSLAFCSTAGATPTTAESLRQTYNGLFRTVSIAQTIFKANLQSCNKLGKEFGFTPVLINQRTTPEERKLWAEAFNAQEIPSVLAISPNGAANRAGLRIGDKIISVNDTAWSITAANQDIFIQKIKELQSSHPSSTTMRLTVHRDNNDIPLVLTADDTCDVRINFRPNNKTGAFAWETAIATPDDTDDARFNVAPNNKTNAPAGEFVIGVESGLDALLNDDAELAFVVAHEFAHIILGHTAPNLRYASNKIRGSMEQAADALAIQFMMRAGYDPEAATNAIRKFDDANRGPITRWLGLFGYYMPTEQRVAFLRAAATRKANSL